MWPTCTLPLLLRGSVNDLPYVPINLMGASRCASTSVIYGDSNKDDDDHYEAVDLPSGYLTVRHGIDGP